MWSRCVSFLRAVAGRRRLEQSIDDELLHHLECQIAAYEEQGLDAKEARRRARAEFGNFGAIRLESREAHGTLWWDTAVLDLRLALRRLRRDPGFTLTSVTTLALALGALGVVATMTSALLFQLLPVPDADEIVRLVPTRDNGRSDGFASFADFENFRDRLFTVRELNAIYGAAPLFVVRGGEPKTVSGALVTANTFDLMRARPVLGRFFTADEDTVPDRDAVAVLTHRTWQRDFGGSAQAVDATVLINGRQFDVVGVAPPVLDRFSNKAVDYILPSAMLGLGYRWCSVRTDPDCTILDLLGRTARATDLEKVRLEAQSVLPAHWGGAEGEFDNSGIRVERIRGQEIGAPTIRAVQIMTAVAMALLLVCAVNLAALASVRARRHRDDGRVRAALGATRSRLLRQHLTEALLLGACGGVAGLVATRLLLAAVDRAFFRIDGAGRPLDYGFVVTPAIDVGLLGLSLIAGLLVGWLPAWQSARRPAGPHRSRGEVGGATVGRWAVPLQAAVAVALLTLAGSLALDAAYVMKGVHSDQSQIATLRLRPRLMDIPADDAQTYFAEVLQRLRDEPLVEAASLRGMRMWNVDVMQERDAPRVIMSTDEPAPDSADSAEANTGHVASQPTVLQTHADLIAADFFRTEGTPVLAGREFEVQDGEGAEPVIILGRQLADHLLEAETIEDGPGATAAAGLPQLIGRQVVLAGQSRRVVGVVADQSLRSWPQPTPLMAYVPYRQAPARGDVRLRVRTRQAPTTALPHLVRTVHRVDPRVPISEAVPASLSGLARARPLRLGLWIGLFAASMVALLGAIGVFTTTASAAQRRRGELGVRQAVGGTPRELARLLSGQAFRRVLLGVGMGALTSWAVLQVRNLALPTVPEAVPSWWLYTGAAMTLLTIGALASWFPARRALKAPLRDLLTPG